MNPRRAMIELGPDLKLPALETQTQTLVVYGGKGMGKTNLAAVLAEELAAQDLRFSWLDPVGVAWGLKHSSDGRGDGVAVLILGGIHGDLPILPTAGAVVADFVVDESVSVIIDISRRADGRMWGAGEKIRFVRDYCVRLFERQGEERRPIMQMIDEAGRYVPQSMPKGAVDIAECVGAIEQLVELGRNVGVGVALITQRSARMNKSVSELAEMMVAFRTVGPRSIEAIIDWFGEHLPKAQWAPMVERLRSLDRGTALIVSPGWLRLEGEYQVRARRTFDSSATPEAGRERKPRGSGASLPDLDAYREKMAETVEEAEAADPRALRRRIAELEDELARAVTEQAPAPAEVKIERVEVPLFPEQMAEDLREILVDFGLDVVRVADMLEQMGKHVSEAQALAATEPITKGRIIFPQGLPPGAGGMDLLPGRHVTRETQVLRDDGGAKGSQPGPLTGPKQRVLDALAWWHVAGTNAPSRLQLAMVAGYHPRTKSFTNALGSLRSDGLIDYPRDGFVGFTQEGSERAAWPTAPASDEDLRAMIYRQVKPTQARILQTVLDVGGVVDRETLAGKLEYHPRTKAFTNALGALRTLGLIDYPESGVVRLTGAMYLRH